MSEITPDRGVHGQEYIETKSVAAGPLADLGAGRVPVGLARPVSVAHARDLFAGVSLLFLPVGHVRLPDRHPGPIRRLHVFPFLAVGTLLVVGSLFGSLVCGWACPFGFLQDLVARIPTPKLRLPGWLGLTRYAVLAGLVFLVPYYYGEGSPWFICRVCPAGALEAAVPYSLQQSIAQHAILWPSRE